MKFFRLAVFSFVLFSCSEKQKLITTHERLADIDIMLAVQKDMTSKAQLHIWDIFNSDLTPDEKQAMKFLYAYMPLSDLADYQADFFLKNVRYALKAREEMPWGKNISEEEFLHFVLPLRVNNENLDNFREVMYVEITQRVKGMDMKQAALEINHWCHEKVNYRGTDSRTSAPLATVSKTFGRCGEESTFTVSAMRTAGIPARQVYTPRWAHTDDNHAWVEVWVDGKWQYLGACEPDVDLNMGWFTEPSSRTMLVHTRAYGRYFGSEEVISRADRYTELNLTSNYAAVKKITVSVKNEDGTPGDSARVEFQLYNYAEYYPLASLFTDKEGFTGFTTGMGDLIVWAAKGGKFSWLKLSVPETDTLELILNKTNGGDIKELFDLVPPHATKADHTMTEEARKACDLRLAKEDSLRNATMATFRDSAWIAQFSTRTGLPQDTIGRMICLSYGNWEQISSYLENNANAYRFTVLDLAMQLADKDFSDTPEKILTDHLIQSAQSGLRDLTSDKELYNRYVLSPRIALENLSPWRSFLADAFGREMAGSVRNDMNVLTNWIRENIRIDSEANKHSRAPLTPIGVYNLRVADPVSRDIFFVAACRAFGIPARLNPETRLPEYHKNGEWLRAGFDPESLIQPERGMLQLIDKNNPVPPQYYLHYTIGFLKDGFYRTLEFPDGAKLTDSDNPIMLEAGSYSLVTGNRMEDGSVLSSISFFTIEKDKLTNVPIEMRRTSGELKPKGKLDFDQLYLQKITNAQVATLSSLIKGNYMVLVVLDPDKEPSKHILNDLGPYADHFNKWGGVFVFAMPAEKAVQSGVMNSYLLPSALEIGIDKDDRIMDALSLLFGNGLEEKLPLVLFCDAKGNVYQFSAGYKIGTGEQLMKIISAIEANPNLQKVQNSCSK